MIADLVPDGVHACEAFGDAGPESAVELFPAEEAVVAGVFDERRKEFTTVRGCARTALARLGETPEPLVPGPMGAPGWPAGVVGSMTHCRGYRAAAVAHAAGFAAIGIDAEPQEPLPGVVAARAVTDAERRLLRQDFPAAAELPLDRLVFCAKEASYKAFSAWLGTRFGFRDFTVRLRADGTFRCVPPGVAMPRSPRCAEGFPGRWAARSGLVLTVVVLAAHADAEF
ncbi:4'-phosphopantetheinyl transferase [Streptomyces sp. NPDC058572]|uniref:4'-phosphopantetheinyl transferase family protein n=1 Tax=Streptomyces sp. NPDC058572 TaxID=3346546 RepID=UPI00364DA126